MDQNESTIDENWVDPDDGPSQSQEWFANAGTYRDGKIVRRGRPKLDDPKQQVTLRLDAEVVRRLKADGDGWQTRANAALREAVGL